MFNPVNDVITNIRRQLTLFVENADAGIIEGVRAKYNRQQHALINAHVTLCREDEITNLGAVLNNLTNLKPGSIAIQFGEPVRFAEGTGVMLPAVGDNEAFHRLRKLILTRLDDKPRRHEPHITIMHPRNSICTDEVFTRIVRERFPTSLTFTKVSLIEQEVDKKMAGVARI